MSRSDAVNDNSGQKNLGAWLRERGPADWVGILVMLSAATYLFVSFFSVRVCEDRLTSAGGVTSVCRPLALTDPPVAAVGLVMLAPLGVFFSEVSGFGITSRPG
jgi:hypothetical protein